MISCMTYGVHAMQNEQPSDAELIAMTQMLRQSQAQRMQSLAQTAQLTHLIHQQQQTTALQNQQYIDAVKDQLSRPIYGGFMWYSREKRRARAEAIIAYNYPQHYSVQQPVTYQYQQPQSPHAVQPSAQQSPVYYPR